MTIEVLDMPDVTDLLEDTALLQRRQRMAIELARGTTAEAALPQTTPSASARIRDMRLHRKRDGTV